MENLKLASNSENNITILKKILDRSIRRSLIDDIGVVYDEICDVEEEEEEDHDGVIAHGTELVVQDSRDEHEMKENMNQETGGIAAAWLKSQKKKKKEMTFEQQFVEYFLRLGNESNVKPNLQAFLSIVIAQVGLYWTLRTLMLESKMTSDEENRLIAVVEKYSTIEMIDLSICDEYGQTIFHLAASLDNTKVFDILLEMDRDVAKYTNKLGKSAREEAIKAGQWGIVQNIALSQMGSRKKNKAKTEEQRIESQHAVVKNFLKERQEMSKTQARNKKEIKLTENEKKEDILLEELLQTVLNLLIKKSPLSDNMLLLVWKYEMSINPSGDKNRLWLALSQIIEEVLDNASNKRDWFWFKTYILQSIV